MMKKWLLPLLCLMLLFSTAALADGYRHATASPTPSPYGTLSGTVYDAATSTKLAGVTVTCDNYSTTTDSRGEYHFDLLPGSYTLSVSMSGYMPVTFSVQVERSLDTTQNCYLTPSSGTIHGTVFDATNPTLRIPGAVISGGGVSVTADSNGNYTMHLTPGSHVLTFEKEGYITTTQTVTVDPGAVTEQTTPLSMALASNEFRVVLTWGLTPSDLDSHLLGTSSRGDNYHIYFSAKNPTAARGEAQLDVDDTSSYGPETVTFTAQPGEVYVYYILDYTNRDSTQSRAMASSGAKIELYSGNQHLQTFHISTSARGKYWEVFRIENGQLIVVDAVSDSIPER